MMEPKPSKPPSGFFRYQWEFRTFYQNKWVQYFVAFLIMANFCANVIEKEIDPSGKKYPILFKSLEDMFNLIFLVELLVNAYGHWLRRFWCSSWNIFDFIVVIVGCISLSWFNIELPGPLSLLRTLRAFRVFRLFKRIPSLNKIIVALAAAIPGTLNAFIVLFLFVSIYAILGVEFFYDFGISPPRMTDGALTSDPHYLAYDPSDPTDRSYRPGSCWYYSLHRPWADPIDTTPWTASRHVLANATHLTTSGPREVLPALTNRGMCFGTEYFGTFFRSWISLFQVLSTESWAEAIGRPIAFHWPYNLPAAPLVAMSISFIFFFSYLLLTWLLLSNVVVSVLLDRFISAGIKDDQDRAEQKMLDALADELDAEVGAIAKEKQKEPPSRVEVEDALHRALAEERERPSREHMEWAEGEKRRFRAEQARISAQLDAASHMMDEVVQRLIERGKLRGRSELAAQEAVQRLLLNLGDAKVRV